MLIVKYRLICISIHRIDPFHGQDLHKACGASPCGVACEACFEALAGVFVSGGALLIDIKVILQKLAVLCIIATQNLSITSVYVSVCTNFGQFLYKRDLKFL